MLLVFLYVGCYLPIYEFESWITGICSPYVVYLCTFAYYVVRKESPVSMHLINLWYVVLVCHQYDICQIMLAVCMLVGMVV